MFTNFAQYCKESLQKIFYPIDFNYYEPNIITLPTQPNLSILSIQHNDIISATQLNDQISIPNEFKYQTPEPPSPSTPVENLTLSEAACLLRQFGPNDPNRLAPKVTDSLLTYIRLYQTPNEPHIPIMNPDAFPEIHPPPRFLNLEEYKKMREQTELKSKIKDKEPNLGIKRGKINKSIFRRLNKTQVISSILFHCGHTDIHKKKIAIDKNKRLIRDFMDECLPTISSSLRNLNRDLRDEISSKHITKFHSVAQNFISEDLKYKNYERTSYIPKPVSNETYFTTPSLLFAELSDDVHLMFNKGCNSNNQYQVTKKCSVSSKDLRTLSPGTWLNDEIINSYCSLIQERSDNSESDQIPKIHFFNTFFYKQLTTKGYQSVAKWTRKINIFEKDKVIIPIHLDVHWTLACIDFNQKRVRYLDSLHGYPENVFNAIKHYIESEFQAKYNTSFDWQYFTFEHTKGVPTQKNGYDCGVFACMFANYLSLDYPLHFNQSQMKYFRLRIATELMTGKLF